MLAVYNIEIYLIRRKKKHFNEKKIMCFRNSIDLLEECHITMSLRRYWAVK